MLFRSRDGQEFLEGVDEAAVNPRCCTIPIEEHAWKKKAEAFERIFTRLTGKT